MLQEKQASEGQAISEARKKRKAIAEEALEVPSECPPFSSVSGQVTSACSSPDRFHTIREDL